MTNIRGRDQIRVLLADDHLLIRAGIRALVQRIKGVQVVGETNDAFETFRQIEDAKPQIVLIDVSIPGTNGLEVLARASSEFPELGIIVLALQDSGEYAVKAIERGAKSCLTKKTSPADLELAIGAVAKGETFLPVDSLNKKSRKADLPIELTRRQYEVLGMIAEGYSTREISTTLKISIKTVESHRAHLMERLNIYDLAGLVRYAVKHGLVKID